MWKSKNWHEQKRSLIMSCKNFITTNIAALCCVSFMAFVGCSNGSNSVAADTEGKIKKKDPLLSDVKINIEDPVAEIATLENYVKQFTDDPNELSFDSHVLAYNGNFPRIVVPQDSEDANPNIIFIDSSPIKEISTSEVAKYFPNTAEVAGNRLNQENCKLYIVQTDDANQPTGHVLTKVSQGNVEVTEVVRGGTYVVTNAYFPVGFLVQDCEGLIDRNSEITHKSFISRTWCGDLMKTREEMMVGGPLDLNQGYTKPNPDCAANAHTDANAYDEWFRTDLLQ